MPEHADHRPSSSPHPPKATAAILVGVVMAGAVVAVFTLWRAGTDAPPFATIHPVLSEGQRASQSALERRWADAEFAALPDTPAQYTDGDADSNPAVDGRDPAHVQAFTATLIDRWRIGLRDPDGVLADRQRDALLRTLARHASARAAGTAEPYLALAAEESRAYHWLTAPEHEPEAGRFRAYYRSHLDQEPRLESASAVRDAVRQYWPKAMAEAGHGFARIGVGEQGALIGVRFQRSDAFEPPFTSEAEHAYWTPPIQSSAAWTREPDRDLSTYLTEHPSAIVASALVLVENRYGFMMTWESYWYWNEDLEMWICDQMSLGSMRGPQVIF